MYFLWPEFLWALLALPLLLALYLWMLRKRRPSALVYPSLSLLRPALQQQRLWRRHVPPALICLALAAAIVGGARPSARVTLPADYMTLMLALDVSRSMLAQDVKPSRIEAAQAAAKAFVQDLPSNVRVGIVAFAGSAQLAQDITDQREDLVAAIDGFQLQRGTATGSGLLLALATLLPEAGIDLEANLFGTDTDTGARALGTPRDAQQEKSAPMPVGSYTQGAIVLLSDGRRTAGPDPLEVARQVAERGVRVYTVAFGTSQGFIPGMPGSSFYARVDEEALQTVAKITGGEFFRASNADDLRQIYDKLSSRFALERRHTEVSVLFSLTAALLVCAAVLLSLWWVRR